MSIFGRSGRRWRRRVAAAAAFATVGSLMAFMLYLVARTFDPPRHVREIGGEVVASGTIDQMRWGINLFATKLLVRLADGRVVGVDSTRASAPRPGESARVQERTGLLGTVRFVELPGR